MPRRSCLRAAVQGARRRRVGADGGGGGEHRRLHRVRLPEGRRRAAVHQPHQAGPPRRDRPGEGQAHPARPYHPGIKIINSLINYPTNQNPLAYFLLY